MAYCYECGEQVAENDVFCPYCGISLQPLAVHGADEDDDSFSKTIAVQQPTPPTKPQPSIQVNEKVAEAAPSFTADEQPLKERLAADIGSQKAVEYLNDQPTDSSDVKRGVSEQTDIPRPKILEALQPVEGTENSAENCSNNRKTESSNLDFSSIDSEADDSEVPTPDFVSTEASNFDISAFDVSQESDELTSASQTESS